MDTGIGIALPATVSLSTVILTCAMALASCTDSRPPATVEAPAPTASSPATTNVTKADSKTLELNGKTFQVRQVDPETVELNGKTLKVTQLDPETAQAIREAWKQLQTAPAGTLSPETKALARDAKVLEGVWSIRHTLARTNGKGGPPSEPLVPATWEFKKDGTLLVRGGTAIEAHYTYTGERLLVSGFGPVQDYHVDRLTDTELQVTWTLDAASLKIENTTMLERAR